MIVVVVGEKCAVPCTTKGQEYVVTLRITTDTHTLKQEEAGSDGIDSESHIKTRIYSQENKLVFSRG